MSGHSKWSTIKHKKGKVDAQRGKIFTKIVREIQSAVREGKSGEPSSNPRLRLALAKAKDANMPADNVKKAIQKALGGDGDTMLEEVIYEGYGVGGVAILIKCLTDNKNRTLPIIRNILTKKGGNLGNAGSVAYLFENKGQLIFEPHNNEAKLMDLAIENGADDVNTEDDGSIEVLCNPSDFEQLRLTFEDNKITFVHAELTMLASVMVDLGEDETLKNLSIIELLENEDDVQAVYSNLNISDDIMSKL